MRRTNHLQKRFFVLLSLLPVFFVLISGTARSGENSESNVLNKKHVVSRTKNIYQSTAKKRVERHKPGRSSLIGRSTAGNRKIQGSNHLGLPAGKLRLTAAKGKASSADHLLKIADDEKKQLPDVEVVEYMSEADSEQTLVGPNRQPEWTTRPHRFATTRAYVLPPGVSELELWGTSEFNEDSEPIHGLEQEFMIGLPNRFQLDFYTVQAQGAGQDEFHFDEFKAEVRWALDEWGEIPLNPTLYAEWETSADSDSDAVEYKALLAEDLGEDWYWAGNIVYEQEYSGSRETELALTSGLNYTVTDKKFNVGAEAEIVRATEKGSRGDPEWKFNVGPSFQYRFTDSARFRVVPLAGLGPDSTDLTTFFIFGYTLGGDEGRRQQTTGAEAR